VTIDGDITFGSSSLLLTTLGSHISVAGNMIMASGTGVPAFFAANLLNLNSSDWPTVFVSDFFWQCYRHRTRCLPGAQPLGNGLGIAGKAVSEFA
jgi:hypothetical protein